MANKIFICHNSKDHDFVFKLISKMKKEQIVIWIDDWEIDIGDSIIEKVNEGLEASDFLIAIISENSIESNWVKRELNSTLQRQLNDRDITILPVLLDFDPTNLPRLISDIKGARFSRSNIYSYWYPISQKN